MPRLNATDVPVFVSALSKRKLYWVGCVVYLLTGERWAVRRGKYLSSLWLGCLATCSFLFSVLFLGAYLLYAWVMWKGLCIDFLNLSLRKSQNQLCANVIVKLASLVAALCVSVWPWMVYFGGRFRHINDAMCTSPREGELGWITTNGTFLNVWCSRFGVMYVSMYLCIYVCTYLCPTLHVYIYVFLNRVCVWVSVCLANDFTTEISMEEV